MFISGDEVIIIQDTNGAPVGTKVRITVRERDLYFYTHEGINLCCSDSTALLVRKPGRHKNFRLRVIAELISKHANTDEEMAHLVAALNEEYEYTLTQ